MHYEKTKTQILKAAWVYQKTKTQILKAAWVYQKTKAYIFKKNRLHMGKHRTDCCCCHGTGCKRCQCIYGSLSLFICAYSDFSQKIQI